MWIRAVRGPITRPVDGGSDRRKPRGRSGDEPMARWCEHGYRTSSPARSIHVVAAAAGRRNHGASSIARVAVLERPAPRRCGGPGRIIRGKIMKKETNETAGPTIHQRHLDRARSSGQNVTDQAAGRKSTTMQRHTRLACIRWFCLSWGKRFARRTRVPCRIVPSARDSPNTGRHGLMFDPVEKPRMKHEDARISVVVF